MTTQARRRLRREVAASCERSFTRAVAWSAAVPVLLTLMVPFVAFRCAERIRHGFTRLEHALHIDTFVHDHMPHRHA